LQTAGIFSAGRLVASDRIAPSERLLKFLASQEAVPVLRECGLEQP